MSPNSADRTGGAYALRAWRAQPLGGGVFAAGFPVLGKLFRYYSLQNKYDIRIQHKKLATRRSYKAVTALGGTEHGCEQEKMCATARTNGMFGRMENVSHEI